MYGYISQRRHFAWANGLVTLLLEVTFYCIYITNVSDRFKIVFSFF
jgi:hypothetical protein